MGKLQGMRKPEEIAQGIARLEKKLAAAAAKKERRRNSLPRVSIPEALPIAARRADIVDAIRKNPVVIITGETGSGKTTQIPKMCLEAGRGVDGRIGCTQPRRVAAITVSQRIAEEMGEDPGRSVGYKIRFEDRTSADVFIKIMTDGILLMEAQADPFLNGYDTIIVDEAHERSLNIDFVLGMLKNLLRKRRDLKVVITSATIDTEKFSAAFGGAPILEVSGRMYPVDIRYEPLDEGMEEREEITHVEAAVRAVDGIIDAGEGGDILVFMPTEQDIRESCDLLEGREHRGVKILPMYARLSSQDQRRVFFPMRERKIVVATNVAETSITIPGIRFVIDTGLARISYYNPRTRTSSLPVRPVSRSSADQRAGRCGRVEHGVCIRLYSREDYESRALYTAPEILRSNLAEVILRMLTLRIDDPAAFPFVDPPAPKSFRAGYDILEELGAIERENGEDGAARYRLTARGRRMARLPLDPRISRMILEAETEGCLGEILVIAAALSTQDPRERPAGKEKEADGAQALFVNPSSDFLTLINIWERFHENGPERKIPGPPPEVLPRPLPFLSPDEGVAGRPWPDPGDRRGAGPPARGEAPRKEAGRRPPGLVRPDSPLGAERLPFEHRREEGEKHLRRHGRAPGRGLPRLGSLQPRRRLDRGGGDRGDDTALCPHGRQHRQGVARGPGRKPLPLDLL